MRRFAFHLTSFFALQLALVAWLVSPYRPNPQIFWAGTVIKHDRLEQAPRPRLVFVGGSNLAFGLDSALIERELAPYSPVNMGLDAGLGLDFLLNEVEGALEPGDAVVLSLEYEEFLGLRRGQASSIARVLEQRPRSTAFLAPTSVKTLLDHGFGFFHWLFVSADQELHTREIKGPYGVATFNRYGDAEWHLDREPKTDRLLKAMDLEPFRSGRIDARGRRSLERFHEACRRRGALVFASHPPLPDHYAGDPRIEGIEERVYRRLSLPVLDQPEETMLPVALFYDTEYHLVRGGREVRTRRLLAALEPHLPLIDRRGRPEVTTSGDRAGTAARSGSAGR